MITRDLQVLNKLGLHARAAAKLVFIANKFVSDITLVKDDKQADARSIMKILMLSASKDSIININIEGKDEITQLHRAILKAKMTKEATTKCLAELKKLKSKLKILIENIMK